MTIQNYETIWYPEVYEGRQGDYAKPAHTFSEEELVALVQKRAEEDGNWAIDNGFVGNNEDVMRKMMAWVSRPDNIKQCAQANLDRGVTVDWVCRDLANASKWILGSSG